MKQPLISVIMPVYNGEKYLSQAIDSILSQSYETFELIIIDDGSTDKTSDIIGSYKDGRIRVIRGGHNGVSAARNRAIGSAKGQYIAFQDADDISHGDRLKKQIEFMESNKDIAMVGTNYVVIDSAGQEINKTHIFTHPDDLALALVCFNDFGQGTVMIRAEIAKSLKYNESISLGEDYDLWTRVSRKYKIANLAEYLYFWRFHSDSAWISNQEPMKKSVYTIRDREFNHYLSNDRRYKVAALHPTSLTALKAYLTHKGQLCRDMALLYCYKGLRRKALPWVVLSLVVWPADRRSYRQLWVTLFNKNRIPTIPYEFL